MRKKEILQLIQLIHDPEEKLIDQPRTTPG